MRIGILGGGQLARMMALAGQPLGFDFVFVDPAKDACAQSLGVHCISDWEGARLVDELAGCDRVTFDFENVPSKSLALLDDHFVVHPSPKALETSQDRLREKQLFQSLAIPVAPFFPINSRPELMAGLDQIGYPSILKTRRMGYDGKGQYVLHSSEDLEPAWQSLGGEDLILEGFVEFGHECALTAVRNNAGEIRFYALSHTLHQSGILQFALSPSPANQQWQPMAEEVLTTVLDALNYVGVLTVEFFVTEKGLVVNEMAPRVHNSAHWSIDAAVCSQFENHLRAIADLPLGSTQSRECALMINFIGQMPTKDMLAIEGLHWHDYAKEPRAGRKVGHATWVRPDFETLLAEMDRLSQFLTNQQAQALSECIKQAG